MNLNHLNDEQLRAVLSNAPRLLVLAGAGTGKTTTLTSAIAQRIDERGVSGYNILALTFTNKAAREMKERLVRIVPETEVHKLTVGTFHAVSLKILRESGHRLGYDADLTVYSPDEAMDLLIWINKDLGEPFAEKKLALILEGDPDMFDEDQRRVYDEYLYRLKRANALDFRRMLTETLRLMKEDEEVRAGYHDRYRHIFVDEYQDTDLNQYTLHRSIDPDRLFCVGDTDQAIYGWRGAVLQIILDFMNDNPGAQKIVLDKNYRSGSSIIEAANRLIVHNRDRYEKTLFPTRPDEGRVSIRALQDPEEESRFLVQEIRDLVRAGRSYKDIAILYRKNFQGEEMARKLREADIPFVLVSSRRSVWESAAAKEIINMLHLLRKPNDDFRTRRFLSWTLHLDELRVEFIERCAIKEGTSTMKEWSANNPDHGFPNACIYNAGATGISEVIRLLVEEFGIEAYYQNYPDRLSDLVEFMEAVQIWEQNQGRDLKNFLDWYALRDDQDILDLAADEDKVNLMTIHGAKGLEFPVVFLIGCVQHNYPAKALADLEEERRIFYVGITRARDRLYVTRFINEERFNYHVKAKILVNVDQSQFIQEMKGAGL